MKGMSWFVITLAGLSPLYGVQSVTISVLELLPVVDGDWGKEVKELWGIEEEEQVGLDELEYITMYFRFWKYALL